jgi:protoporphyrinogen oxidase
MRDVVIIGGGLSGLAAAVELERLGVPYRLIEVKPRLGGSIMTETEAGFVLDGGAFAFPKSDSWDFLTPLGLVDSLITVHEVSRRHLVALRAGTQSVVDALAAQVNGTVLRRMAVSSLGAMDGRFMICLENGLMLEAAALIVAAPARHAERMLRTLAPELSLRLSAVDYDTITRVNLGYRAADLNRPITFPWDVAVPFYMWTENPARVPEGGLLLQIGVRLPPGQDESALSQHLHEHLKPDAPPLVERVDYWPDADPLPPHRKGFAAAMASTLAMLPEGVALAGSDYAGFALAARIASGQAAAARAAAYLRATAG